ncbi:MAG TPA: hypothetical protein PKD79_03445 [Candidatus Doudnabacteria bacterium]|nr:hypothetical protein [Candidatus Doudnabacteria bacterium]
MIKLTHHPTPSRTFILLTVIVLCFVYAALVLSRINHLYEEELTVMVDVNPQMTNTQAIETETRPNINTSQWVPYANPNYPMELLIPANWQASNPVQLSGYDILTLNQTNPRAQIRIFISTENFAGVAGLAGRDFTTQNGYNATAYEGNIYTIKAGEYYYTFNGTSASAVANQLLVIIHTAKLN